MQVQSRSSKTKDLDLRDHRKGNKQNSPSASVDATRVPIIQKYVVDGAKIYTDGHKGYLNLNELPNGYEHFSCVHKEMKFSTCQLIMHDYKMKPSGSKYSIVV